MNLLVYGQDQDGAPRVIGAQDLDNPAFPDLAGLLVINMLRTPSGLYLPQGGESFGGGALVSSTPSPATGLLAGTTGLTTVAAQLPNHPGRSVLLFNDPALGIIMFIGSSASQPIKLLPGDSWGADLINLNLLYARAASGTPALAWIVLT